MAAFDKSQLDALVKNLEDGSADLQVKSDADATARDAAAKAKDELTASQGVNRGNVRAIKGYILSLDEDGGIAPAAPAEPAVPVAEQPAPDAAPAV